MVSKARITDPQGNSFVTALDISKPPVEIIREGVKENKEFCRGLLNGAERELFMQGQGQVDTSVSAFSLVRDSETIRSFDLNVPLCEQLDGVKLPEDETPEFIVSVQMAVG